MCILGVRISTLTPNSSDSVTYTCLLLGIIRAGFIVFPISPRNSPAAVAHLLRQTDSHHVFVSPDHAMQTLIAATRLLVSEAFDITTHSTPTFETLFPSVEGESEEPVFVAPKKGPHDIAAIYHSSGKCPPLRCSMRLTGLLGTTAFPKPI